MHLRSLAVKHLGVQLVILSTVLFFSCGKKTASTAQNQHVEPQPCVFQIAIVSEKAAGELYVHIKSVHKSLTMDRDIILKGDTVWLDFTTHTSAKVQFELKTKDSFGPTVYLTTYINQQQWFTKSDTYFIEFTEYIPDFKQPILVP